MTDWPAILAGRARGPIPAAVRLAAASVEPGYRLAIDRRNRAYDTGRRPAVALGRPTLSIGNLTAGGTGKTPVTLDLTRRLLDRGHRPAILTRGYRGGDEADELQHALGASVRVGVHPSRVQAARQLLAESPGITCFVLDDAFQHRRARRDLDLVLIDATAPFGTPASGDDAAMSGRPRLLPRGLLREPLASLARADAVLVTRADQATADVIADLDRRIAGHHGSPPVAHASMTWASLDGSDAGRAETARLAGAAADRCFEHDIAVERLAMLDVVAVSAIGNPAAFRRTLDGHARRVIAHHVFPDHHRYGPLLLRRLLHDAKRAGAHAVVTTAKDDAKWRPLLIANPALCPDDLPILRPRLAIAYDRPDAIDRLLDRLPSPTPKD
jgi:tetraacyldisaccharide 4'-kinase